MLRRRLLPPILSAVLALAVAVPITWSLASNQVTGADSHPGPSPLPTSRDELRTALLTQLPGQDVAGTVELELAGHDFVETTAGVAPGRYQVHLICGTLRRHGEEARGQPLLLRTPDRTWRLVVPCPSTPLSLPDELDFTDVPAGAVAVTPEYTEEAPVTSLLLVRLVPVTGG